MYATAYDGRILAEGKGNAVVTVFYGGIEKNISVTVLNQQDLKAKLKTLLGMSPMTSSSERQTILNKASAMTSYQWIPTQNLTGWKSQYTFPANTFCYGIPYTQTPNQCDDMAFGSSLNYSDSIHPFILRKMV